MDELNSSLSSETLAEINHLVGKHCHNCVIEKHQPYQDLEPSYNYEKERRYNPDIHKFEAIVTPVKSLTTQYSQVIGMVTFEIRRKHKTVTLQWEPFSGIIAANGFTNLSVNQSICYLPPYPIYGTYYLKYKNETKISAVVIDPTDRNAHIKLYLNTDLSANGINLDDAFNVYAGSISWIIF